MTVAVLVRGAISFNKDSHFPRRDVASRPLKVLNQPLPEWVRDVDENHRDIACCFSGGTGCGRCVSKDYVGCRGCRFFRLLVLPCGISCPPTNVYRPVLPLARPFFP